MKIGHNMDLGELAGLMGPDATPDDAAAMRDALIGAGHADTDQVGRADWLALLDLVVAGDAAVHAADDAIARSIAQAGVVVCPYTDALNDELETRCTDGAVTGAGREYWGETADGHTWRVRLLG